MYQKGLILVLSIIFSVTLSGQNLSWKKLKQQAENALAEGNYEEAGTYFEEAWKKKTKKRDLIFQAGECFYTINDYRKAAAAYQVVKDDNDTYPLVGLKYARSLKQDAQYAKAKVAFQDFLDAYSGQGRTILEDIIRKEVKGCDLAAKLPLTTNRSIELQFAGPNINSSSNEFSPFFAGGQLFLSSDKSGKARIISSRIFGGSWDNATTPTNFPVINKEHYANATITPDGSKMYFTICNSDNSWDQLKTRCEIFETSKTDIGWSKPNRLPDFININGVTATHPSVHIIGNKEYLYYASNRDGGRGGMDIWYTTRDLASSESEFSFPVNLGPSVNSIGDEITPFYNTTSHTLYFSSNGHISIGGFDVFKTQGGETSWTSPTNVGLPLNTSADDYGYMIDSEQSAGFIVSNRIFGGDKITTTDTDIFYYDLGLESTNIVVRGSVYDKNSGKEIDNFSIQLFQVQDNGSENLLLEKPFSGGGYELDVLADRTFKVVIKAEGFSSKNYSFTTDNPNVTFYGQPVYLEDNQSLAQNSSNIKVVNSNGIDAGTRPTPGETYTSRGTSPSDNFEYSTNAPRHPGSYFKIQLSAVRKFNPDATNYKQLAKYGRFDTEKLLSRSLTRVLLADFFTKDEAFRMVAIAKDLGFSQAFVVKYDDGIRYGKIKF